MIPLRLLVGFLEISCLPLLSLNENLPAKGQKIKCFKGPKKVCGTVALCRLDIRQKIKIIINEADANIVRSIYESYITGDSVAKISRIVGQSKSRIFTILRNPIYIGKIKYAGKFSQENHKPIISEDIFNLAQETHKKQVRKLRLYKDYLLAGLIRCKECGSHMTPCHTNKNKKRKMQRYYYYRCTSTFKKDWNNCQTRQVNANRLIRGLYL